MSCFSGAGEAGAAGVAAGVDMAVEVVDGVGDFLAVTLVVVDSGDGGVGLDLVATEEVADAGADGAVVVMVGAGVGVIIVIGGVAIAAGLSWSRAEAAGWRRWCRCSESCSEETLGLRRREPSPRRVF